MRTTLVTLAVIFSWFFVGWLVSTLKTIYWQKYIIDNGVAEKYPNFKYTPWKVYLPICFIWLRQSALWFDKSFSPDKEVQKGSKMAMPIIPISFMKGREETQVINKTRINYGVIKGDTFFVDYEVDSNQNIRKFLSENLGLGILVGWLNIFFWAFGLIYWLFILIYYPFKGFAKFLGRLFYPSQM